jgi:hypothetical protein
MRRCWDIFCITVFGFTTYSVRQVLLILPAVQITDVRVTPPNPAGVPWDPARCVHTRSQLAGQKSLALGARQTWLTWRAVSWKRFCSQPELCIHLRFNSIRL